VIYTVQDLSPESRDRLVYNLLYHFASHELQCRRETEALLRDIRARRRVDELSRNPLFCTTLVLVYKYRQASLPERRVDVYQELVTLMLGFWEMQREGVAAVRELALEDGTGRDFLDENEAVEAKERALIAVADWMQHQEKAEVNKAETVAHLADYFAEREGADVSEKEQWARGFLIVAHQRSGLLVEVEPEIYAFSHQNFREYLAATALVNRTDTKMVAAVLAQAKNSWWHEVILLAAAHKRLSAERRELLLAEMLAAGHVVLAGQCAVDAGRRLPAPMQQQLMAQLHQQMTDSAIPPQERAAAGAALDALGWLPPDLNTWIRCPARADNRQDLLAMKYPLTNAQFELFMADGGYENPAYWNGEGSEGWQWRLAGKRAFTDRGTDEPEFWQDTRFGRERRGYPVVGISWYEATAYMAWLTALLRRSQEGVELPDEQQALIADLVAAGATDIRLPTETEWVTIAGGEEKERYPWDKMIEAVTKEKTEIVQRANVYETEIGSTSPVGTYPHGASYPFGVMDMA
ncbi:MAG: SUMF1/EgtB/PvdO family nonheme iron enzyme, partial [Anaerolineae bacterium]|nr:SUMF1/EgtB/PvdO family nonheme iron enzyme [Anaerolineae bacterium]